MRRERENNQQRNKKPTVMQPDFDSENATQLDLCFQRFSPLT
jgi:hypothetical protein